MALPVAFGWRKAEVREFCVMLSSGMLLTRPGHLAVTGEIWVVVMRREETAMAMPLGDGEG